MVKTGHKHRRPIGRGARCLLPEQKLTGSEMFSFLLGAQKKQPGDVFENKMARVRFGFQCRGECVSVCVGGGRSENTAHD